MQGMLLARNVHCSVFLLMSGEKFNNLLRLFMGVAKLFSLDGQGGRGQSTGGKAYG